MTYARRYSLRVPGQPDLANAYALDHLAAPSILAMSLSGIAVDVERFNALTVRLESEQAKLAEEIYSHVGNSHWDISSADQLEGELFNRPPDGLGLDPGPIRLTPTGKRYKVDDDALAYLEPQHPVIRLIRDWRERQKIVTTYSRPFVSLARNGRIYTTLNQTLTTTRRLSSSRPNLQNIPTRTLLGREVRKCFVPRPGNVLAAVDLSQIEVGLAAHLSQDANLIELLRTGRDIHATTAAEFFQWPRVYSKSELTPETYSQRSEAKRGVFGAIYEISPQGLFVMLVGQGCDPLLWPEERCGEFLDVFYADIAPGLLDYQQSQHAIARRYKFAWTLFGGVRWIPEVDSTLKRIRAEGGRYASNTPIQGSAADLMKFIGAVAHDLAQEYAGIYPNDPYALRLLLPVHDELLLEGRPELVEPFLAELTTDVIPNSIKLSVPISGSSGMTTESWGDLER